MERLPDDVVRRMARQLLAEGEDGIRAVAAWRLAHRRVACLVRWESLAPELVAKRCAERGLARGMRAVVAAQPLDARYFGACITRAGRLWHADVIAELGPVLCLEQHVDLRAMAVAVVAHGGKTAVLDDFLSEWDETLHQSVYRDGVLDAASRGRLDVLKVFVDHGADERVANCGALRHAARYGHVDILCFLIERGCPVAVCDQDAVRWAAANGHVGAVDVLLQHAECDPSVLGQAAFICAAEAGHASVVQRLLKDERVKPDTNKSVALCRAARHGRFDVVKLLLDDGRVDATTGANEPLRLAAIHNHPDVLALLMAVPGTDASDAADYAMHRAATALSTVKPKNPENITGPSPGRANHVVDV